ncbi:ribonuclease H [Desulfonatronospira thiodismutans ASO3-1]|uniref:Ribonuclease H n=1 Tax=Desulfonatronospira thiodismutans ASO3-1 TaxID=555779 RepID=D6SLP5_9BACT|nr:ribonuclease HI [Desulfonatronospira thiodismutans]EFI35606.1 ribonuclease H [Desulfonatronospira thiodismutans ASO3-1]
MSRNNNTQVVDIYTDGACLGNPGPGGYAAILKWGDLEKEISQGTPGTTNNRMELMAVLEGLKALKYPCRVRIHTDSQYIARAINEKWLEKWQRNGWKTAQKEDVKNRDLWEELAALLQEHKVEFKWVRGHSGHEYNERCDSLARQAAQAVDD